MYTAQDIEVFVLTHKRPEFLKETLDGYLKQTVQGFRLAVFSNGHSPETKQLLEQYASCGVEDFYVEEELSSDVNHARALQAASRKILVMAHDDDFIHPRYLENILKLFNKYENLSVVVSGEMEYVKNWEQDYTTPQRVYYLPTKNAFAAYIYSGGEFTFSSACYKTKFVKKVDPYVGKPYGKVGDVPFMVAVCGPGSAAVTCFPFIKSRIHEGQDTFAYATGPTAREWFNLSLFYKSLLDTSYSPQFRWIFLLQNYRHIRIGWRDWCRCEHSHMNFGQFCQKALACGALSRRAIWVGRILRGKINRCSQRKLAQFQVVDLT